MRWLKHTTKLSTWMIVLLLGSTAMRLGAEITTDGTFNSYSEAISGNTATSKAASEIDKTIEILQLREAKVIEREQALNSLETELGRKKEALLAQLRKIEAANANLEVEIGQARQAAQNDIQFLVRLYSKMKPKQAAAVIELMQDRLAAGLLYQMEPDKSASIMAHLTPEKSYALSTIIAGRNAARVQSKD